MINIRNNSIYLVSVMSVLIAFSSVTVVDAQTPIETQVKQMDNLNDLKYQLKKTQLEGQLAQAKKACKLNDGCLNNSAIVPIIKTIASRTESENQKKSNNTNNIENLSNLSIVAIVNGRVFFKNYNNSFKVGDTLISDIRIEKITNSSVTLMNASSSVQKVINIDWSMD
ncbi:hypothetical protein [Candidatus Thiodubiliella endoseptemdiera]|uniref:hypothetical protein n=1 Tax=Candidatus Thiodubiliella endoseptemdiera TaxID=2738886 RepID=UPI0034E00150